MLNIREAIEKGQYQKKVGGYIVWGDVLLHKHDIAMGRVKVLDIKQDGSCKLLPIHGQQLALPHSGVSWGHGNIFQLPSSRVVASVNN